MVVQTHVSLPAKCHAEVPEILHLQSNRSHPLSLRNTEISLNLELPFTNKL